jgi:hypothetical protein
VTTAKTVYELTIGAVDGERSMSFWSPEPEELLRWLQHFDHEGAVLSLSVHTGGEQVAQGPMVDGEAVYRFLRSLLT